MTAMTLDTPAYALEIRRADTTSPTRARRWIAWCLEAAGIAQATIDDAVLAASELVTNAVVHTDTARILVSARVLDAGVRLVVHDDAAPAGDWPAPGGTDAEHGRGLVIVEALAEQLEVSADAFGTTITALIPAAG